MSMSENRPQYAVRQGLNRSGGAYWYVLDLAANRRYAKRYRSLKSAEQAAAQLEMQR